MSSRKGRKGRKARKARSTGFGVAPSKATRPDPTAESRQATAEASPHAPPWLRVAIVAVVLVGSAVFLFARLGHYALWDDEALTAIPALGVWRTGDTTLVDGKNVVAYRNGTMMVGWHDRTSPPLMFYLAAPALGLLGRSAWAARLPFALCGLGCVALLLRGAWRSRADAATWVLLGLAILGNVSFFLYCRQCRYYAPSILLSVAIAYAYLVYDGRRRSLLALALLSLALLATNPMHYAGLYAVLGVDYALWGRKRRPLSGLDWLWLFGPQLAAGVPLMAVWNPGRGTVFRFEHENWFVAKPVLLYRNLRDLNRCEFGTLPLLALTPLLYLRHHCGWLLRAPLALLVYIIALTVISPQPIGLSPTADIRYLAPAIPLCIAIEVMALRELAAGHALVAGLLGLLAFGTNVLNLDPFVSGGFRTTVCEYVGELVDPPGDPYTAAAAWINAHVTPGQSVCAIPLYMTYPLMFHAPAAVYAWQFNASPDPEQRFPGLDPVHIQGKMPPDFFVAFGPAASGVRSMLLPEAPVRYEQVATLDIFWKDLYRPELFWRTFRPVTGFDKGRDAVYIFRKTDARPDPGRGRAGDGGPLRDGPP